MQADFNITLINHNVSRKYNLSIHDLGLMLNSQNSVLAFLVFSFQSIQNFEGSIWSLLPYIHI